MPENSISVVSIGGMSAHAWALAFAAAALMSNPGSAFAAATPQSPKPAANCPTQPQRTACNAGVALAACACNGAGGVMCCGSPGAGVGDAPGKSSIEAKVSPETEALLKTAEGTLQDVRENTDFLATLWKWTTIVAGIVIAVTAAFGIKTVWDLNTAKDKALEAVEKANQSVEEMKASIGRLSQEATANLIVMMQCLSLQPGVDEIESERAKLGATARGNPVFEKRAADIYRGVLTQLAPRLQEHDPQDPAVASYAYDFLGFAQYRTGNVSLALECVKKSLAFMDKNPTALYNAACYAAAMHLVDASIEFLQRAIEHHQDYLISAKTDPDFDPIRASTRFMTLVGA